MKKLLFVSLLVIASVSSLLAQESENSVVISGTTIILDTKTEVNQGFQIVESDEYKISWMYLINNPNVPGWQIHQEDNEIFMTTSRSIEEIGKHGLTKSQKKTEITNRRKVTFSILGSELNGYVLESRFKKNIKYILVSAGEVNNRNMLIQVDVYSNPVDNDSLPTELKKIITFN